MVQPPALRATHAPVARRDIIENEDWEHGTFGHRRDERGMVKQT
jgi:hypothetical protein